MRDSDNLTKVDGQRVHMRGIKKIRGSSEMERERNENDQRNRDRDLGQRKKVHTMHTSNSRPRAQKKKAKPETQLQALYRLVELPPLLDPGTAYNPRSPSASSSPPSPGPPANDPGHSSASGVGTYTDSPKSSSTPSTGSSGSPTSHPSPRTPGFDEPLRLRIHRVIMRVGVRVLVGRGTRNAPAGLVRKVPRRDFLPRGGDHRRVQSRYVPVLQRTYPSPGHLAPGARSLSQPLLPMPPPFLPIAQARSPSPRVGRPRPTRDSAKLIPFC
ncbi:hypothetical protein FA13DRAFT_484176 [Coprinellus micaceus]|uniref:Uncharacterized protein n=1 Tax=Coprinellus micaceus TaxID=71717 RepID=A0A4Y7SCT8_COPMI|nr:hypothetical protein FA13DRAFT_484176 [Coprinellus micaceus]